MGDQPVTDVSGGRQLAVGVLGPLRVEVGGQAVHVGGDRPRSLLAVLVAARGRPMPGDRLATEIYGGSEPNDPVACIRVHVANVRRALRDAGVGLERITTVPGGYAFELDPAETDAGRFDACCRAARQASDHAAALELLDGALALTRGDPYQGVCDLPAIRPEAVRLAAMLRSAQADRAERLLALGQHRAAVGDLESLVEGSPEDEGLCALLMLALYRSGQQAAALRHADGIRRHLRRECGVEPGRRLLELEQAILRQDVALDWRGDRPAPRRVVSARRPAANGTTDATPAAHADATPAAHADPRLADHAD
ncbi:MAG: AfsR/SARP family transcriptional regulator, partial [Actinomycetota bacterium]|nr:AfsR/SARP family transcriptional regulator [Actinomycetota bacterium]